MGATPAAAAAPVTIDYPLWGAVFPPGFPPPAVVWRDAAPAAGAWRVTVSSAAGELLGAEICEGAAPVLLARLDAEPAGEDPPRAELGPRRWRPAPELWRRAQEASRAAPVTITIRGFAPDVPERFLSLGSTRILTAGEPVGAPIFYRAVPLPFARALTELPRIRWMLGDVASADPPRTLLTGMSLCGNCHSFSADGALLGMDVDYGSDKGSYIITSIQPRPVFRSGDVISWSDYRREDGELTFGLLAQVAPDGRHVISTVKDRSVFAPTPDFYYSQRFFPVRGILAVYDRDAARFSALPGADDPGCVQSNPAWSPDGETVLFARAPAHALPRLKDRRAAVISREEAEEFFDGGKRFRYDLYRVPFNGGAGGAAEPVPGAAGNGKSNYFAKYSPDGRWIVFCQADSFMLLQPDSLLYIMPAAGGAPRRMACNMPGRMNSWHSWSPNGRWLVFASKADGPFTQLWLTHVDAAGNDAPAVLLERLSCADRAANIPEFVNVEPAAFRAIDLAFDDVTKLMHMAVLHEQGGRLAEAMAVSRDVLGLDPDHAPALYLLALCLARSGRPDEALGHAERAVALGARNALTLRLLGGLLSARGEYLRAVAALETALALAPEDPTTLNNLAWVLATSPQPSVRDGPRALELARRACASIGEPGYGMLDTVAAAQAECGDFAGAAATMARALELAGGSDAEAARALAARLDSYRARRPYRSPP